MSEYGVTAPQLAVPGSPWWRSLQLTITLLMERFIIKPKNIDEWLLSQSMHTFSCNQLTTSPFHCAVTNCPFSCTHTSTFHQKHQETLVHNSPQDEITTKLKNLQYQQQLRLILTVHQNVDSDKHTSTCLITRGTTHQCYSFFVHNDDSSTLTLPLIEHTTQFEHQFVKQSAVVQPAPIPKQPNHIQARVKSPVCPEFPLHKNRKEKTRWVWICHELFLNRVRRKLHEP